MFARLLNRLSNRPALLSWRVGAFWCAWLLLAVGGLAGRAPAQTTTFAQFLESNGTNDFQYTNNGGTSASFNTSNTTPPAGSAVDFKFQNIAGLPADLSGFQSAHLVLSASTTAAATQSGSTDTQNFNQTCTLTITRDTAAAEGNGSRTMLLQVTFTISSFSGTDGGNSATLSGSGSGSNTGVTNVKFSSDFLAFDVTTQRALALSFSSLNQVANPAAGLALGPGNFFTDFTAAASGTFSSNPVPTVVPEAATLLPVGLFLAAFATAGRWQQQRRRRRRQRQRCTAQLPLAL
ncbi:MAG: hypothetical protein JO117_02370 [Verrucomicrobia bacterium]|nr:hypothetical protein [Verrucomicrobiota bacterium]MBV9657016.1 hypothetical protein [Verrucomicrobiota bacterium]